MMAIFCGIVIEDIVVEEIPSVTASVDTVEVKGGKRKKKGKK
jgi:hypothetical protein